MNKTTPYAPMLEAPADAPEKIRAMFAEMDRMAERIAKDHEEIARTSIRTKATLAEIATLLDLLKAGYKCGRNAPG